MKKKTNVKRHVRRTKTKVVPVRQHTRKNRGMKSQGVKYCDFCEQRTPYDRMENSADSPTICLVCGKDNNKLSKKNRSSIPKRWGYSDFKHKDLGKVSEKELDYLRDSYGLEPWEIEESEAIDAIKEYRELKNRKSYGRIGWDDYEAEQYTHVICGECGGYIDRNTGKGHKKSCSMR